MIQRSNMLVYSENLKQSGNVYWESMKQEETVTSEEPAHPAHRARKRVGQIKERTSLPSASSSGSWGPHRTVPLYGGSCTGKQKTNFN